MRLSVKNFALEMEEVLKENDYKGGWQDCSIEWLNCRLVEELGEYFGAVAGDFSPETRRKELVDIANYCMMLYERTL